MTVEEDEGIKKTIECESRLLLGLPVQCDK